MVLNTGLYVMRTERIFSTRETRSFLKMTIDNGFIHTIIVYDNSTGNFHLVNNQQLGVALLRLSS